MNVSSLLSISLFRLSDELALSLNFIPGSAQIQTNTSRTAAGILYATQLDFSLAKVQDDTHNSLAPFIGTQIRVECTDANGFSHSVGTEKHPARLLFDVQVGRQPGDFNGYRCIINHLSPILSTIT